MIRVIHKTPLFDMPGSWTVTVPGGDVEVIYVEGGQAWYEFTPDNVVVTEVVFLAVWTGVEFEKSDAFNYAGTCRMGSLVVHLYWRDA
jgi:hypothetical protein